MKARTTSSGPSARAARVGTSVGERVDRLLTHVEHDPHSFLGAHAADGGVVVRAFRPGRAAPTVIVDGDDVPMNCVDDRGLYEAVLAGRTMPLDYELRDAGFADAGRDPYAFLPSIGDLD